MLDFFKRSLNSAYTFEVYGGLSDNVDNSLDGISGYYSSNDTDDGLGDGLGDTSGNGSNSFMMTVLKNFIRSFSGSSKSFSRKDSYG
ncbi:hypothetical protein F8M41_024515 [Gigaspora margarita]|uniref:Uncharacterized protein n=1 Tax=Gigaspora margarita TaxID=4874 RepID=A0A8H3XN03_GIGMA|nr:hypothetical protein F8M41_024515 [Gigaspora margarita]